MQRYKKIPNKNKNTKKKLYCKDFLNTFMHILKESEVSQNLYIIPRSYPASVDVIIKEDESDTETELTITTNTSGGYLVLTKVFALEEDKFYTIVVKDTDIIYIGRIFCTNQTDYNINYGKYTERSHDNGFITRD